MTADGNQTVLIKMMLQQVSLLLIERLR